MLALLALGLAAGCSDGGATDHNSALDRAVPVLVAKAIRQTVASWIEAIGRVEAYSTVEVKARVTGQLVKVHFKEGQRVEKGQILFTLDPRPFKAALLKAQGDLARDQARAAEASADEQRYSFMLKEGVGSRQQYDQAHAQAAALKATVSADQAAVETARLNLAYTTIRSPIAGRTGKLLLHAGNLVKANADKPLVVVNRIRPVYVDFSLPESRLAKVRGQMRSHKLEVRVTLQGAPQPTATGDLSFIDNRVDPKTGTFQLKAIFPNAEERLWPGQFVTVSVKMNERKRVLLVPSQAVQTGQEGTYVFVVGNGMKVKTRQVSVGETFDGKTEIERGLKSGEIVVTDGQLRLIPGVRVRIKSGLSERAGVAS